MMLRCQAGLMVEERDPFLGQMEGDPMDRRKGTVCVYWRRHLLQIDELLSDDDNVLARVCCSTCCKVVYQSYRFSIMRCAGVGLY